MFGLLKQLIEMTKISELARPIHAHWPAPGCRDVNGQETHFFLIVKIKASLLTSGAVSKFSELWNHL